MPTYQIAQQRDALLLQIEMNASIFTSGKSWGEFSVNTSHIVELNSISIFANNDDFTFIFDSLIDSESVLIESKEIDVGISPQELVSLF